MKIMREAMQNIDDAYRADYVSKSAMEALGIALGDFIGDVQASRRARPATLKLAIQLLDALTADCTHVVEVWD